MTTAAVGDYCRRRLSVESTQRKGIARRPVHKEPSHLCTFRKKFQKYLEVSEILPIFATRY